MQNSVVGILLAAGRGARFGGEKLLADMGGERIGIAACLHLMAAVPCVIAVVRPHDDALAAALEVTGTRVIRCANSDDGMGASLAYGVRASIDAKGWVVMLADMPWIQAATIVRVATAVDQGAPVAAPFYRGMRGHPVGFGNSCAAALAALTGDEGARAVVAQHRETMVRIDVDDPGVLRDVDTRGDLAS
jgi:molybdenum cofactor cytidylyltransferase